MPLIHKRGSLFSATNGFLVHSCNAAGEWGGGPRAVATQMRERFPLAYRLYRIAWAKRQESPHPLMVDAPDYQGVRPLEVGTALVWSQPRALTGVVSLIVSHNYGQKKDAPAAILRATQAALFQVFSVHGMRHHAFHSPQLNAGLFGVPWRQTEELLSNIVKLYNVDWTVWTP